MLFVLSWFRIRRASTGEIPQARAILLKSALLAVTIHFFDFKGSLHNEHVKNRGNGRSIRSLGSVNYDQTVIFALFLSSASFCRWSLLSFLDMLEVFFFFGA